MKAYTDIRGYGTVPTVKLKSLRVGDCFMTSSGRVSMVCSVNHEFQVMDLGGEVFPEIPLSQRQDRDVWKVYPVCVSALGIMFSMIPLA